MSQLVDDLAASGTPLHDDEFVAYLLTGLDEDYNLVFTRADPLAPSELYAQLFSLEHHTSLQGNSAHGGLLSAMTASRGRGSSGGRGSGPPSCGSGHGRGHGCTQCGGFSNSSGRGLGNFSNGSASRPQCQVCDKIGHTAKKCWCHYEDDSNIDSHMAGLTTSFNNNWYSDSRAMDHITRDLDKLTMHDAYGGHDQIHVADGSGMHIAHIGTSIIPTPSRALTLNNVLHVPSTQKNLFSVHRFALDNDTFIEFHPYFFLIKDRKMRKVLLHGQCKGGLYPLPSSGSKI
jgi:hypothetical protein